jgi:hypothetical protein
MRVSELLNEKLKRQTSRRFKRCRCGYCRWDNQGLHYRDELKELHPITLLQTLEQKIIPR